MATYTFSTITAAQALAFTASDTLTIDQGSGNTSTVLYVPASGGNPDQITLMAGSLSVTFGAALATATKTFTDGSSLYIGGSGADGPVTLGATNDGLYGGAGGDTLNGGDGTNQLQGNQGDDLLRGGAGRDVIYGGQDNDQIFVGASASGGSTNFAQGNKGADTVNGSSSDDDILLGGQGNDLIGATGVGVPGETGFHTNPTGATGGGNDFLNGNLGNDSIYGGSGSEQIRGEDGDDLILSGGGRDTIDAGAGNDVVGVTAGNLVMLGDGDDLAGILDQGADTTSTTIDGGAGNDGISSGPGGDSLVGGSGADTLDGFGGADTVAGGAGADQFQFYAADSSLGSGAFDTIIDWTGSEDHLYFDTGEDVPIGAGSASNYAETSAASYAAALTAANAQIAGGVVNYVSVQVGGDVYVFADEANNNGGADGVVLLVGRTLNDIAFGNFDATTQ